MLKWVWRIIVALAIASLGTGAVLFTGFPDLVFRKGFTFVHSYRRAIEGDLKIKSPGYWTAVDRGVERRVVVVERGGRNSLDLYALRINPAKVKIKVIAVPPREINVSSIAYLAEKTNAVALINASYFSRELGTLGLCVAEGKTVSPLAKFSENQGILLVSGSGAADLIHRDKFNASGVTNAIQSGPWLVFDGLVQHFDETDRVTRRSCIGMDKKRRIILVATDTIFSGITLAHLAEVMAAPFGKGGFESVQALNLDGGTSTQMVLRSSGEDHLIRGFVNVPVLLGVYRKE